MTTCPQCRKTLRDLVRRCPSCQADLDLLVDYVSHLQGGLERADNLTRAGELGDAFWAYMEVLEVDPDNAAARKQVGRVMTAVRQFDRAAEGRRWLSHIRHGPAPGAGWWVRLPGWALGCIGAALLVVGYVVGYLSGSVSPNDGTPKQESDPELLRPKNTLGG